jgi:hypothetical protein
MTVVDAVTLLLAPLGSGVPAATVAVLMMLPPAAGSTFTTTVIVLDEPEFNDPIAHITRWEPAW